MWGRAFHVCLYIYGKWYTFHISLALNSTHIKSEAPNLISSFNLNQIVIILSFTNWQHCRSVFCAYEEEHFTYTYVYSKRYTSHSFWLSILHTSTSIWSVFCTLLTINIKLKVSIKFRASEMICVEIESQKSMKCVLFAVKCICICEMLFLAWTEHTSTMSSVSKIQDSDYLHQVKGAVKVWSFRDDMCRIESHKAMKCVPFAVNVYENSVGLSSPTNPKPKGQPFISLPAQANLTQWKAEPLRCLTLRTRGGHVDEKIVPWELSLPPKYAYVKYSSSHVQNTLQPHCQFNEIQDYDY